MRNALIRLMVAGLITVAGTLGSGTPASACSCAKPALAESFEVSDAVFLGEIAEIERPGSTMFLAQEARYVFAVDTVFKGEVFEQQSIVTEAQGSACGLELDGPGLFLIFATESGRGGPSPVEGEFASMLCSGNTSVGPDFTADDFGPGLAPLSGSSPSGSAGLSTLAWGGLGLAVLLAGVLAVVAQRWLRGRPSHPG